MLSWSYVKRYLFFSLPLKKKDTKQLNMFQNKSEIFRPKNIWVLNILNTCWFLYQNVYNKTPNPNWILFCVRVWVQTQNPNLRLNETRFKMSDWNHKL